MKMCLSKCSVSALQTSTKNVLQRIHNPFVGIHKWFGILTQALECLTCCKNTTDLRSKDLTTGWCHLPHSSIVSRSPAAVRNWALHVKYHCTKTPEKSRFLPVATRHNPGEHCLHSQQCVHLDLCSIQATVTWPLFCLILYQLTTVPFWVTLFRNFSV